MLHHTAKPGTPYPGLPHRKPMPYTVQTVVSPKQKLLDYYTDEVMINKDLLEYKEELVQVEAEHEHHRQVVALVNKAIKEASQ